MKLTFTIMVLAMLVWGCKKDTPANPTGNNPTGTNPTGSNPTGTNPTGSSVTIISISPDSPYPDDQVTITGTGFSTDKTKDTVEFGVISNNKFESLANSSEVNVKLQLLSISATKIVVKPVDSSQVDLTANYYSDFKGYPFAVRVKNNGTSAFVKIPYKKLLIIDSYNDPDKLVEPVPNCYPGDSLIVKSLGPTAANTALTIKGVPLSYKYKTYTPPNFPLESEFHAYIPPTFVGESNNDTATVKTNITLTTLDGKIEAKQMVFWASPRSYITKISTSDQSYSSSGLKSSGGAVNLHITGFHIKSDCYLIIKIYGTNTQVGKIGVGVTGFPNETDVDLGSGFPPGLYNVSMYRIPTGKTDPQLQGACNFSITN